MFVALATAALGASAAYSQALSPTSIATSGLTQLSAECRSTVLSLVSSPLVDCLGLSVLAPAVTSNSSITPVLDEWMTKICSSNACDQELLDSTAQNISTACGTDVAKLGVDGMDVENIFGLYPLVRELVCLKTTEPFEANSTMSSNSTMTNTTMDAMTSSNSTNGTFCVTSLLTEVSDYLGMNLTVPGILDIVMGSNTEGRQALSELPPTALCQDCIYAGAGLIEQQYPGVWNKTIGSGNFTVGGFLNQTCVNETFPEIDRESNNTITLPESVFPSAENSTYPYAIMYSNGTYTPEVEQVQEAPELPFVGIAPASMMDNSTAPMTSASSTAAVSSATSMTEAAASSIATATAPVVSSVSDVLSSVTAALPSVSAPVKRDVTAAKRRWVGQQ